MMIAYLVMAGCAPLPESAPEEAPEAVLVEPLARCADPDARRRLGPFTRHALPDWTEQPENRAGHYASWGVVAADLNGDGWKDIFLPSFSGDRLYLGRPGPSWEDRSSELLPYEPGESSIGAVAADLDGDGDLDLAVARSGPNAVYRNDGVRFTRLSIPAMEAQGWESRHVSAGDLDGDGLPELFFANHYSPERSDVPDPNELYANRGGGRFEDISARMAGMALEAPSNVGGFFDADGDGDQDLYVVSDKPQDGYRAVLLRNDGRGNLSADEGAAGLDVAIQGMGLGLGDLNGDRADDVVVTGWGEHALLMSAADGVYYDASASFPPSDPERVVGWGVELVDLDLDGDPDLVVTYGPEYDLHGEVAAPEDDPATQPVGLYENQGGVFVERSAAWGLDEPGVYRGVVPADLNDDGYPDLVLRALGGPAQIWLSRCGADAPVLVSLAGDGANPTALGARVTVEAGGLPQTRVLRAGSTSLSSGGPPELSFGLGDAAAVERLSVLWPDGSETVVEDLPVGVRVKVLKPD